MSAHSPPGAVAGPRAGMAAPAAIVLLLAQLAPLLAPAACRRDDAARQAAARTRLTVAPWDSVLAQGRGATVTWLMWRGDPSINAYIDGWVAPRLRARDGIVLNPIDAEGPAILNALVVEREAHRTTGTADLVWINGETFHNLRRERLLFGPWANRLPNARAVDSASPIVARDFGEQPVGYESPWGRVEFALIYDSARFRDPPHTYDALAAWVRAHPGRFTYDQGFTGLAFIKGLMYHLGGGAENFAGPFDSARYVAVSRQVWEWLDRWRPFLWRHGEVYPRGVAEMEQLFANREIDFAMSYNENEVVSKVRQGVLPPTARAFILRDGALANAHFVGIPFNAPHPAAAMVVADFLVSPEAQLEKLRLDVWGDGTVIAPAKLGADWAACFATVGADPRQVPRDTLDRYAEPEADPRYAEMLQADWRTHVRSAGAPSAP